MKSFSLKKSECKSDWIIVDASSDAIGRVASKICKYLLGKHKETYTPHMICGSQVVVVKCAESYLTGKKETDKIYRHYTGYMGGLVQRTYKFVKEKHPHLPLYKAVERMLAKNRNRKVLMNRLHIFQGIDHPYSHLNPMVV